MGCNKANHTACRTDIDAFVGKHPLHPFKLTYIAHQTNNTSMKPFYLSLLVLLTGTEALAQNVGVGTTAPTEKLHVAGNARIDSLASTDTTVVLADTSGKLRALSAGTNGQVLTSQGPGRTPQWTNRLGGGIYLALLGPVTTATVSNLSAPAQILVNRTITPVYDTVLVSFSASAIVTASTVPATPLVPYCFQVRTGITAYKEFWVHPHTNSAGLSINQGKLSASFTIPVPVTKGVPVNINIFLRANNTVSGSQTIQFDTGAAFGSANMIIWDMYSELSNQ
jgi:hypothetical protein